MAVGVGVIDVVVVVLPVAGSSVVRRVDVNAVDLASMRELQRLQNVVVLALDHDVSGLVAAASDSPEAPQAGIHGLTEVRGHHQGIYITLLVDHLGQLVGRQHRPVRMANLADSGSAVVNPEYLKCCAVGVVAERDFDAYPDRVLGKPNPLRQVGLEDKTKGPLRPNPVNMCTQVGTQRGVIDPPGGRPVHLPCSTDCTSRQVHGARSGQERVSTSWTLAAAMRVSP